ncbi:glucuronate isomerase [Arthrobacter sp. H5]|uniref:glucuronate isomerase n=1 Tax=Arthrobacter sp. H5 TaxID=1267973 RepID=UPI00048866C5|nr:glucuronate isomerase [Arthrobacter sp. H5]
MPPLAPHPDRLLPADPTIREIARSLYKAVAEAPIYSPHGHVDAGLLLRNAHFSDPSELLITPDHYVLRLLHASGVRLEELGVSRRGLPSDAVGREVFRAFCANWHVFLGTPVSYWFESEFAEVFGVTEHPSAATSDAIYNQICEVLTTEAFRPRALFERFNIAVLATTDDPADDLGAHAALRKDDSFAGRVLPTFRADIYMTPDHPSWISKLGGLAAGSGIDTGTYSGLLAALRNRRAYFKDHGCTSTDAGTADAWAIPLDDADAQRLHAAGMAGTISTDEAVAYRRNMLYQFAKMSMEDGLVMQLHSGVIRSHHKPTLEEYGPDTGHDLPDAAAYTRPLQRVLNDFGTDPAFRLVLFTVDETVFSREIAPLAGFYPSVYVGAPWWFIDSPAAIDRFRAAATDSAGFYKTSGFIDDTRAFCSIPARHDMSRRVDAGYLARLVATHQLSEEHAHTVAQDLVAKIPKETFRL